MKIDNHCTASRDTYGWTLYREIPTGRMNDKGEEIISKNHTYHANIKQVLKTYCDEKLGECETIDEVLRRISELETQIENLEL